MQLMQLKPFKKWLEKNILIRDEIDHDKKQITTYVIYKGDLPEEEQKRIEMLRRAQYDWWCETCDQGFSLMEHDDTREDHKPVCAQCGSVLITPEKPKEEEEGESDVKPD